MAASSAEEGLNGRVGCASFDVGPLFDSVDMLRGPLGFSSNAPYGVLPYGSTVGRIVHCFVDHRVLSTVIRTEGTEVVDSTIRTEVLPPDKR